jgi:hypothetical protein
MFMAKLRVTFLGLMSALFASPSLLAGAAVEIPVIDMRDATPEQARQKAQQLSENGVAILYLSAGDPPARAVQTVASECADEGFQVRALVLADPDLNAEGMQLYGATSGPLGPTIPVTSNMRSMTNDQVKALKKRLEQNPAGMAAIDPLDVMKCRYVPVVGSRVRKEKVCSTPREDAAATEQARAETKRFQDRSANQPGVMAGT